MAFHYASNASPQGDQHHIFVRRKTTRVTFPHEDLIGDGFDQGMQLSQYQGMQQSQYQGMQQSQYQGMQECQYEGMQQPALMPARRPGQTKAGKKADTKDIKKGLKEWKEQIETLKAHALKGASANDPTSNLITERVKILEDAIQNGIDIGEQQLEGKKRPGKTKAAPSQGMNAPGTTRTGSGHTLPRQTRAAPLDPGQQKKLDILNKAIDAAIQQAQPRVAKVASKSPPISSPKSVPKRSPKSVPKGLPKGAPKKTKSTWAQDEQMGYPPPFSTPDSWDQDVWGNEQVPHQWMAEEVDDFDMVGGMQGGGYYC